MRVRTMDSVLVLAFCGHGLIGAPAAAGVDLYGVESSFLPPPFGPPPRLHRIDPLTGTSTLVGDLSDGVAHLAYDPATDTMFGASFSSNTLYRVDYNTAQLTPIAQFTPPPGPAQYYTSGGIEWDPTSGRLYVTGTGANGGPFPSQFGWVDLTTGQINLVSNPFPGGSLSLALGYDSTADVMYAAGPLPGAALHRIDRASGATTLIGGTLGEALAYHPAFGMITPGVGGLSRVDLLTGATTPLVNYTGPSVAGLVFVPAPGTATLVGIGLLATSTRRRRVGH